MRRLGTVKPTLHFDAMRSKLLRDPSTISIQREQSELELLCFVRRSCNHRPQQVSRHVFSFYLKLYALFLLCEGLWQWNFKSHLSGSVIMRKVVLAAGSDASRWSLRGVVRPYEYCIIVFWNWKQGHNKAFPTSHDCVRERVCTSLRDCKDSRSSRVAGLEVCTCIVAVFCFCKRSLSVFGRSEKKKKTKFKPVKVKFGPKRS